MCVGVKSMDGWNGSTVEYVYISRICIVHYHFVLGMGDEQSQPSICIDGEREKAKDKNFAHFKFHDDMHKWTDLVCYVMYSIAYPPIYSSTLLRPHQRRGADTETLVCIP